MTHPKMTSKPTSSPVASLDDFIGGSDPVTAPPPIAFSKDSSEPKLNNKVGKPPKPSSEVRNKTVQITLTEAEYATLKQLAGKVPISTFLRDEMRLLNII